MNLRGNPKLPQYYDGTKVAWEMEVTIILSLSGKAEY